MNDTVHFLHLYIAPERLAREAVMRLDCEPRTLELRDRTYIQDDSLIDVCRQLLGTDWSQPADRLAASSAAETVLHHLLNQGVARKSAPPARGGLAPAVRRRVMDYVDAHLHEALTLDQLAGVAALSTYHFARMFHTSFGEPPHAWVRGRRLAHARSLLAARPAGPPAPGPDPAATIAPTAVTVSTTWFSRPSPTAHSRVEEARKAACRNQRFIWACCSTWRTTAASKPNPALNPK